jgi:hypothetical protein
VRRAALVPAIVMALAAGGCDPYLSGQSVAPPGRTARLDEVRGFWDIKSYRLELSRGVAFALTCRYGGACEHVTVVSDDPAIAEVRQASLGVLERAGFLNQQQASAVVVVGKAPGKTKLHVTAKQGHREIAVTIVPEPSTVSPVSRTAAERHAGVPQP